MSDRKAFLENLYQLSKQPTFQELLKELEVEQQVQTTRLFAVKATSQTFATEVAKQQGILQGLTFLPMILEEAKKVPEGGN